MPVEDDEGDDEQVAFGQPLPPEDRLWRHPSELGQSVAAAPPTASRPWGIALAAGLTGAVLATAVVALVGGVPPRVVEREVVERVAVQPVVSSPLIRGDRGVVAIAEAMRPAIVRVDVVEGRTVSAGSGVLFRDNGHILTNAHVVDGADRIEVVLTDARTFEADVIGVDRLTDIAVIRIEGDDFPSAVLGATSELRVGEPAVAIGSPLGLVGGPSVTTGVISAVGRRLENPHGEPLHDMIQTDAPIAPGSSGGALVDSRGAVIGITTVIALGSDGGQFGFAIPIEIARAVAEDLIESGHAKHVWIGIEGGDLPMEQANELGVKGGAFVRDVMRNSPAATAQLEAGDVIVAVDNRPVVSMSALIVALRAHEPGHAVQVRYLRDGRSATVTMRLAERPASMTP